MAHRSIGQERFGFAGRIRSASSLDQLGKLIDWEPVSVLLDPLYSAAKGEPAWPPLAMFKALLLSIWYDLSDVKLAEALDDRTSFRRFCGFSGTEATPERTAFVRFRRELVAHKLDRRLFTTVTAQLTSKAVAVKIGTLVDVTIITSASEDEASEYAAGSQDLRYRFEQGLGHKAISCRVRAAPSTVRETLARATVAGLAWPLGEEDVSDAVLEARGPRPAIAAAPNRTGRRFRF